MTYMTSRHISATKFYFLEVLEMKKIIAVLVLCVVMLTIFVGCNPSTCDECGKTTADTEGNRLFDFKN